jgi:HK97 family phage major capsid protein
MTIKEMLEKRASLLEAIQALAKRSDLSETEQTDFNAKADEFDKLRESIALEERKLAFMKEGAKVIEHEAGKQNKTEDEIRAEYRAAFRKYVGARATEEDLTILNRANVQSTTGNLGGYTIPQGFSGLLDKAMLYFLPFDENLVTIWRTATGNTTKYPTLNNTANKAYIIGEGEDATTGASARTFGEVSFGSYKLTSGMLAVDYELIEDSDFNIEQVLAEVFGESMARGLSYQFTLGNGTTAPQGVVTAAVAGATAAAPAAITRDDIMALKHSVDAEYRKNGTFMFNDNTLKAILSLSNGTGDDRPIYQVSAIQGKPDLIEGYPFVINNEMDDIGAGNISMLFGDFKKYVVRMIGQDRLKVSTEVFAETDQLGMALYKRVDAKLMNAGTNPIKKLTHPLT